MTIRLFFLVGLTLVICVAYAGAPLHAAQNIAFVTSVTGSGNLGSWPDAAGAGPGLAAADAICKARAAAAGLPRSDAFVAWLSDSSNDAYCRVHGLMGTVAGNCGQASLPEGAGPWVRVDGYPFAPVLSEALGQAGAIYAPVRFDEYGNDANRYVFTATSSSAEYLGLTSNACSDWTSASADSVLLGDMSGGTVAWTSGLNGPCSNPNSLLCMHVGAGDPLPPFRREGAWMFVTSTTGNADLGAWPEAGGATGLAAGDAICQARASAAGLAAASSYVAWLSTSGQNAIGRLTLNAPWTRVDGVPIAGNQADLIDGSLWAAPNVTETGGYLGDYEAVWTGTTDDGLGSANTCLDWTEGGAGANGVSGAPYRTLGWWTSYGPPSTCGGVFHLYCFSNVVAAIFIDGFESASVDAWSGSVTAFVED